MKNTADIPGWFDYDGVYNTLIDTIPNNGTFVECGAWLGKSSSYLCDTIANKRPDISIYIVDSWQGSEDETETHHKLAVETDIYPIFLENMGHRQFTPIRALSTEAAGKFDNESIDVIFIDMCHKYECVISDIEVWYPKLKLNGYMAGHDMDWSGVNKAVNEKFNNIQLIGNNCWMIRKTFGVLK